MFNYTCINYFIIYVGLDFLVYSLLDASNKEHVAVALCKLTNKFLLVEKKTNKVLQDVPIEPNLQVDNVKKCYEHSRAKSDRRLSAECIIFTIRNFQEVLLRY